MDFYTGDRFPAWRDDLLVTGPSGWRVERVRLGEGGGETGSAARRAQAAPRRPGRADGFIYDHRRHGLASRMNQWLVDDRRHVEVSVFRASSVPRRSSGQRSRRTCALAFAPTPALAGWQPDLTPDTAAAGLVLIYPGGRSPSR
jgi:hypothetical protein